MADVRAILAEIESVELRADEWGSLERLVKDDFTVIKSVAVAYNEVVAAFLVPYRVAIAPYMSDESCINNSATFVRVALMLLRGMGILSASELHNLEFYVSHFPSIACVLRPFLPFLVIHVTIRILCMNRSVAWLLDDRYCPRRNPTRRRYYKRLQQSDDPYIRATSKRPRKIQMPAQGFPSCQG